MKVDWVIVDIHDDHGHQFSAVPDSLVRETATRVAQLYPMPTYVSYIMRNIGYLR